MQMVTLGIKRELAVTNRHNHDEHPRNEQTQKRSSCRRQNVQRKKRKRIPHYLIGAGILQVFLLLSP